ncbi:MAG TPA: aspartate aminotransferase family protein [Nitrososphaerales archaeon]|nr:aspartate aminotransferase family protein [Nitrososphaerales archaeon]
MVELAAKKKLDIIATEDAHGPHTYQKFPVAIVRGKGALVWDEKGREYLDCMGGYGVAIVGHSNDKVVAAIKRQAETLITCHGSLYNDARAEFLETLTSCSPKGLDAAFLSSSGAEAVEVAIKLGRKVSGKKGLVAMKGAYHGKTAGALSATWSKRYREPFEPLLQGVKHVENGDLDALEREIDSDIGAVIVEPIQGEGGIVLPPKGFLRGVREICDKKGVLLIADEIQTGLGRTGKLWAMENWGVVPDIMTVAKGLAGGVPIGATVTRADILGSLKKGEATSTFGGNPLACAAGTATLRYILDNDLPSQAKKKGKLFLEKLNAMGREHQLTREARGLGLMLAFELRVDIQELLNEAMAAGAIFTYSGRTIVRMLPPLVITERQIDKSVKILGDAIAAEERRRASGGASSVG